MYTVNVIHNTLFTRYIYCLTKPYIKYIYQYSIHILHLNGILTIIELLTNKVRYFSQ